MKTHLLKTVQPYFDDVALGIKIFELRIDDRDFQVGDILNLQEFVKGRITGRIVSVEVTYKLDKHPGLKEGYCVLGIEWIGTNF